jgi:hypothetical protein
VLAVSMNIAKDVIKLLQQFPASVSTRRLFAAELGCAHDEMRWDGQNVGLLLCLSIRVQNFRISDKCIERRN